MIARSETVGLDRPAMDDKASPRPGAPASQPRVAWVDYAKGWCIVLVVMMHSALGVGFALEHGSWLDSVVAFAKPFRMPDFFVVAGLFAAGAIAGPWRRFLDRKILHFAYFYAMWVFIELAVKSRDLGIDSPLAFAGAYLWHMVEPFGSMWFIQVLPLLYLATRLVRAVPFALVFPVAVGLHYWAASAPDGGAYAMESRLTTSTSVNSIFLFWAYFLVGTRFREAIFRAAAWLERHPVATLAGLAIWVVGEAWATGSGASERFGLDLPLGLCGAAAVIAMATLFAQIRALAWLSALGRHSLAIYLGFFLPMAATRILLVRVAPHADVGLLSLAVTCVGVTGPLALQWLVRATPLRILFERPAWARLADTPPASAAPHHLGATPV